MKGNIPAQNNIKQFEIYRRQKMEKITSLNLSEYQMLFNLTPSDLEKKIIDFPAGLNSFTSELFLHNQSIIACDEIYVDPEKLKLLAEKTFNNSLSEKQKMIITQFIKDFEKGFQENRYIPKKSSTLPFNNHQFDLMLSPFFLSTDMTEPDICWNNLVEMLRVATEVRISPLLDGKNLENLLGPLMLKLQQNSFGMEIRSVTLSDLPHAAMLRIWSQNCELPEGI